MKWVFAGVLLLFVGMWFVAQATLVPAETPGVVRIRWATDANPARDVQTSLFGEMYPGVEVVVDPGLGGDQTKLIVQCATGTGPDVVDVYSKEQMMALVDAGILLDLTPYAEEMGFGVDKTYPAMEGGLVVDGRQYRFPCNVWANCVVYNKRIFDDHGVPYPRDDWTWEEFIRVGKLLKDSPSKSGEEHIPFANWNNTWLFGDLFWGAGGHFYTEDGLTCRLDSEEAVWTMRFYHDLMHVHNVVPTAAQLASISSQGGWGSGGLTLFSGGKAAMISIGRWYIIQVPNYPQIAGALGAARLPRVGARESSGMTDARAAGINIKGRHIQEALKFLQYLASPEYSALIVKDGDSLPPNPLLAQSGEALVNPAVPDPAFHQPFVDAEKSARPVDTSPFVDALQVQRWLVEHIDKVENKLMTPEEAMSELTHSINQQIRINLERQPHLQRKYEQVTGRPYDTGWWRQYQGHPQSAS